MRKTCYVLNAFQLLCLLLSSSLPAQTNISGSVSGVWTISGSPYLIVGNASVPAGSTLQIDPGVSVQFTGEYVLLISGNLQALGTVQDSIKFTSTSVYSKGLHIINGQDTCRLTYCSFMQFYDRSITSGNCTQGGAVYASNTKMAIDHCNFSNNRLAVAGYGALGGAISLEGCNGYIQYTTCSSNKIISTGYSSTSGRGGAISNYGNITISKCLINGNGIDLSSYGSTSANCSAYGGGISTTYLVEGNTISGNYCYTNADCFGYEWNYATALSRGGGLDGGTLVEDNILTNNHCNSSAYQSNFGTGVGNADGYSAGGAIYSGDVIKNNIISDNACTSYASSDNAPFAEIVGGGIAGATYLENNTVVLNSISGEAYNGNLDIKGSGIDGGILNNCIVYFNTGSSQLNSSTANYSCIQGGFPGTGNLSGDPLLVVGQGGNYYLSQLAAGQSQQSPCVDAGNPATPLFQGTTRTDNIPDAGIPDMGYHYPCPQYSMKAFIKVVLQGPFFNNGMVTGLNSNNYLPLLQPYQGPPWNYDGTEAVTAIPNSTLVDWVLLELRQAPDASQALPATMLCRQAFFVDNAGNVTGLDGNANLPVMLSFGQAISPGNNIYIIVWHRNHLGVLSAGPLQQIGNVYSYNFTTGVEKAYGGGNGHIELAPGIWGMISGDGDANYQVNNADKVDVWVPQGGQSGYLAGDFNMDGQVGNQDKIDQWAPNSGRSSQVPTAPLSRTPDQP